MILDLAYLNLAFLIRFSFGIVSVTRKRVRLRRWLICFPWCEITLVFRIKPVQLFTSRKIYWAKPGRFLSINASWIRLSCKIDKELWLFLQPKWQLGVPSTFTVLKTVLLIHVFFVKNVVLLLLTYCCGDEIAIVPGQALATFFLTLLIVAVTVQCWLVFVKSLPSSVTVPVLRVLVLCWLKW